MTAPRFVRILGIRFFSGDVQQAVTLAAHGGLIVFPSAPVLVELPHDVESQRALSGADLAITDSGLMVLLWRYLKGDRLERVSGLAYLKQLMSLTDVRTPGKTFWIMPSDRALSLCQQWLREQGIDYRSEDFCVAPVYAPGRLSDAELAARLEPKAPRHIVIGLGGGTQERLGLYLKQTLPNNPSIHCIGAALAFLTGDQAPIPQWADRLFLGWLCRCVSNPARFVPRYWRARHLVGLVLKYGSEMPVVAASEQTNTGIGRLG